jgi:hypothetical protein
VKRWRACLVDHTQETSWKRPTGGKDAKQVGVHLPRGSARKGWIPRKLGPDPVTCTSVQEKIDWKKCFEDEKRKREELEKELNERKSRNRSLASVFDRLGSPPRNVGVATPRIVEIVSPLKNVEILPATHCSSVFDAAQNLYCLWTKRQKSWSSSREGSSATWVELSLPPTMEWSHLSFFWVSFRIWRISSPRKTGSWVSGKCHYKRLQQTRISLVSINQRLSSTAKLKRNECWKSMSQISICGVTWISDSDGRDESSAGNGTTKLDESTQNWETEIGES